jgi:glutamate formiminotransferase/formiminotetrahydrofolate cyclodeaminase
MSTLASEAQTLKDEFLRAVDDDARAFEAVMAANRLPKATHDEHTRRVATIQETTKRAIEVPLSVMRTCAKLLPLIERVAAKGNKNSISDAGVAVMAMKTAAGGAYLNVLINLSGISDEKYAKAASAEARTLLDSVSDAAPRIADSIEKGLGA